LDNFDPEAIQALLDKDVDRDSSSESNSDSDIDSDFDACIKGLASLRTFRWFRVFSWRELCMSATGPQLLLLHITYEYGKDRPLNLVVFH
jgi:hypothetical protein